MANKNFVVRHGLEVSGNAGIEGNLGVSGQLSVGGGSYLSGAITAGTTLIVNSDTNLNGSLQVSGNSSLKGTLQVNSNTSVGGALTVTSSTNLLANTAVAGTLSVQGASYLSGSIQAKGNVSTGGALTVTSSTNLLANTAVAGTLSVQGGSYLSGSIQAKGNVSTGGNLTVAGAATISQKLTITGNTSTIAGASFNAGWFRIGDATTGLAMDPNEIYFTGEGNLGTFSGNLNLNPAGQINAASKTMTLQTLDADTVQASGVLSGGQLRTASFRTTGTLNVQGASYLSGAVQAKGNVSTGGALTVTSSTNLLANTAVAGTLSVQGASYLSGTVQAKGLLSAAQLRCGSFGTTGTLTVCGSADISGSLQVGGFVSANTYNFEMFGAVPAYNNSDYSTINWSIANSAIQLQSSTDTSIGMAFPAFRVNSATNVLGRWRITIQVKASAAATSGLYIRVYEYDGELPTGKVAVSNDATNAVVQEDTRQGIITGTVENVAIGTDWVTKTFYYSPTATAVYASVVVLNWIGIGTNHLYVRPPVIQPEYSGFVSATTLRTASFRSTGALTVQGESYLSGTVQAKGVLSGAQLRCASLRVTGGTAAICGGMDICGSLQVAAVLSAGQGRLTSANIQRGNISAMTYGSLNGGYVSATTLRTTSFRTTGTLNVQGGSYLSGAVQVNQLKGTSLRLARAMGASLDVCGSVNVSGSLQVTSVLSGGQIRGYDVVVQRMTTSVFTGTAVETYDKIRVWNSSTYAIGMTNGLYHGGLGLMAGDYAMTFTMNNSDTRGFLWRHSGMDGYQGCMSLTAGQGLLTVAGGVRIGFGLGDLVSPDTTGMQVNGTISCDAIHAGASNIETTGVISGTTLRCASLRVTGGIAAICGSMDICGSLQVAGFLSCNGLHAAASAIQTTGTISGSIINAGQLRCTSFKSEERLTVSSAGTTGNTAEIRAAGSGNHYLLYQYATNQQYGGTMNIMTALRAATADYQFIGCYSSNGSTPEYVFRGNGQAGAQGAFASNSIDYAEYFEWKDGNPNNEARFGQPVYLISGEKIALATSGIIPIGIISKSPAFTAGSAWNTWDRKYLRDEWNALIEDENGEHILNPDWDPDQEYIPREDRPEWDAVGLVGKLSIQKDYITDTIKNNTGWIKMSDINDNVERWLIK